MAKLGKHSRKRNKRKNTDNKPFRSLVVIPKSHRLHWKRRYATETQGKGKCRVKEYSNEAVQLDIRPSSKSPHQSVLLLWNSKTIHQGMTRNPGAVLEGNFRPKLEVPTLYEPSDDWQKSLEEKGFVAIRNVLEDYQVNKALDFLLSDLQILNEDYDDLENLDEVRECHLPGTKNGNDLRILGGLCHGRFAWYLRQNKQVSAVFEKAFGLPQGSPMIGSCDVVALAPPEPHRRSRNLRERVKNWLHLDYTPKQGDIYQGTLQLFPSTRLQGSRWSRIALMICKAPAHWAQPTTTKSLIAASLLGAASKATAAVTQGALHPTWSQKKKGLVPRSRLVPTLCMELAEAKQLEGMTIQEVKKILDTNPAAWDWLPNTRKDYLSPYWQQLQHEVAEKIARRRTPRTPKSPTTPRAAAPTTPRATAPRTPRTPRTPTANTSKTCKRTRGSSAPRSQKEQSQDDANSFPKQKGGRSVGKKVEPLPLRPCKELWEGWSDKSSKRRRT